MSAIEMRDMTTDQMRAAVDFLDDMQNMAPLIEAKVIPLVEQGVDGPDRVIGFASVEEWHEITDETGRVVGYADPCPEEG